MSASIVTHNFVGYLGFTGTGFAAQAIESDGDVNLGEALEHMLALPGAGSAWVAKPSLVRPNNGSETVYVLMSPAVQASDQTVQARIGYYPKENGTVNLSIRLDTFEVWSHKVTSELEYAPASFTFATTRQGKLAIPQVAHWAAMLTFGVASAMQVAFDDATAGPSVNTKNLDELAIGVTHLFS